MITQLIARVFTLFTGSDQATWIGHGVQGLILGFLLAFLGQFIAFAFVVGAFFHRELSDFVSPIASGSMTLRESFSRLKEDGIADFITPVTAATIGIALNTLLF